MLENSAIDFFKKVFGLILIQNLFSEFILMKKSFLISSQWPHRIVALNLVLISTAVLTEFALLLIGISQLTFMD